MAVGDVAVLRIVGRYQSQNIINTMHYRIVVQANGDTEAWQELVDEWWTNFGSVWTARHIDAYELVGLKAFTVKGVTRPPGERSLNVPGDVVGTPQVSFACRTVTFYSASSNPRRRGRLMLSGGDEGMFEDSVGSVVTGEVIALTAMGTSLLANITSGDNQYEPVLYQKLPETISELVAAKGRVTPSSVRSRRIRRFLIG